MAIQRLDKIISDTGVSSRRGAKQLIRSGRVRVNGNIASSSDEKFDPKTLDLIIDGQKMRCQHFWYFMLNKPVGLLSATEDFRQKTVLDLFTQDFRRLGLFPVGSSIKTPPACYSLQTTVDFRIKLHLPDVKFQNCIMSRYKAHLTPPI